MTSLDPNWNGGLGYWSYINIGRNNPDGWTVFNGQIGAALLWKTALGQAERNAFEVELGTAFGIPINHTLTASAGTNGTITPSGAVVVADGGSQTFTITADSGYMVSQVLVDGVNDPAAVAAGSRTFSAVSADHSIAAVFVVQTADPFTTWINANYPGLSDKTPGGDPDGDGMTNQAEFAFGLDPSSAASVNPISVPLNKATGKFSYTRRATPASTGLVYTVLTSSDLVTWTADATATAGQNVTATTGDVETVEVTVTATPVAGKLFVRVAAQ